MAKRFMYVCLGILALAVAFHLGAQHGSASIVDHAMTGIVAQQDHWVLLDNGETWGCSDETQEWSLYACQLPVPLSDVKFWQAHRIVTNGNDFWRCISGTWVNLGSPPGLVSTQPTTWGAIKAEFGE